MNKKKLILVMLTAICAIVLGVSVGSVFISPLNIIAIILKKLLNISLSENFGDLNEFIIWQLRLPRVILAFLVGGALSASGAVVQSVLKNPLASPFTLGVSSGASFGAGIIIATGFTFPVIGSFTMPLAGLLCGMGAVFFAISLASKIDRNLSSSTIILTGMVFSLFINAVLTLIAGFFPEKYLKIMKWQMGTFSAKGWRYVGIMLPVFIICLIVVQLYNKELDILTFGEEQASAIGVETKKTKWILLVIVSVLTGTAVAFSGVIGFIDLIAPHVVRRLFSSRHKIVVPVSALFGGIFMIIADLISRTIAAPKELPVTVVTAIIGAPVFAYIYLRKKRI